MFCRVEVKSMSRSGDYSLLYVDGPYEHGEDPDALLEIKKEFPTVRK